MGKTLVSAIAMVAVSLSMSACGGSNSADDLAKAAKPLITKSDDAAKTELRTADDGIDEDLKNSFCSGLSLYQDSQSAPSQQDLADIVGDQYDTDTNDTGVQDAASSLQSLLNDLVTSDAGQLATEIGC